MPKVLPEYREQRRQQILEGAAACFARTGFHQTTMQAICDETGLSPGAVYRYFRSKEEIIEAMCQRGQAENRAILAAAFERGDTLSILEDLIQTYFITLGTGESSVEDSCLNVELISEAPHNEYVRESLQRSNDEVRSLFAQHIVLPAQARSEINPELDPDAVARVLIAVYHGFITQKVVDNGLDVLSYADVLRSLFGGSFWLAPTATAAGRVPQAAGALRH